VLQLLRTLFISIPPLLNVASLLVLVYFIYAIGTAVIRAVITRAMACVRLMVV
jgi:hypothetical protein